jgi:hypothetical protein
MFAPTEMCSSIGQRDVDRDPLQNVLSGHHRRREAGQRDADVQFAPWDRHLQLVAAFGIRRRGHEVCPPVTDADDGGPGQAEAIGAGDPSVHAHGPRDLLLQVIRHRRGPRLGGEKNRAGIGHEQCSEQEGGSTCEPEALHAVLRAGLDRVSHGSLHGDPERAGILPLWGRP